jgi:hypothetical protein
MPIFSSIFCSRLTPQSRPLAAAMLQGRHRIKGGTLPYRSGDELNSVVATSERVGPPAASMRANPAPISHALLEKHLIIRLDLFIMSVALSGHGLQDYNELDPENETVG